MKDHSHAENTEAGEGEGGNEPSNDDGRLRRRSVRRFREPLSHAERNVEDLLDEASGSTTELHERPSDRK